MDSVSKPVSYPLSRGCPFDPAPEFTRLRAERPITRVRLDFDGSEVWLVSRHEDVRAVLRDPRFSADFSTPGFPARMTVQPPGPGTFIRMDPPDHSRLRRALLNEFKPRRVEELRPHVERIVHTLIDRMVAGPQPVDLLEAIAFPLPILVICELLGVPYDDRPFFERCTAVIGDQNASPARRQEVRTELWAYMDRLIDAKDADPADDLLSRLTTGRRRHGISREEVAGIATLLIIAGYETIANQIGIGTLALLRHPDQIPTMLDPATSVGAVDEILRHQTIIAYGLRRAALADVEVAGEVIRAGEGVIAVLASGNRDDRVYEDPDVLNLERIASDHLAFGFGIHQCLGQVLARMELQVLWQTLFRRLPTLRLAIDVDDVQFRDDMFVYGVKSLPVVWSPENEEN